MSLRKRYMNANPSIDGFYECALCGFPIHEESMTVDHIKTKRDYPSLAYDLSNLQPTHARCNRMRNLIETNPKTSKRIEEGRIKQAGKWRKVLKRVRKLNSVQ